MVSQLAKTGKESVAPSGVIAALERIRGAAAADSPGLGLSKTEQDSGSTLSVRSTLSNLIFLKNELDGEIFNAGMKVSMDELVSELCLAHPSRFLVASLRSDVEGLQTSVSSQCVVAHSGAHVCSEEVYISVDEGSSQYLSNYILSLLVPDVSAVLVVLGDVGVEGEAFHTVLQSVAAISDRIIFDSGAFSQLVPSAQTLRRGDFEQPLLLSDLTWMKLARWRELISEQFESQAGVKNPECISRIEISFKKTNSSEPKVPVEALLLTSWLIDSLHADVRSVLPTSDGGMELVLKKKHKFKIQLSPVEDEIKDSMPIKKVDFAMERDNLSCGFSIVRVDNEFAEVSIGFSSLASSTENSCDLNVRRVSFANDTNRNLLIRTLNQPSCSDSFHRIFEKMLTITQDDAE